MVCYLLKQPVSSRFDFEQKSLIAIPFSAGSGIAELSEPGRILKFVVCDTSDDMIPANTVNVNAEKPFDVVTPCIRDGDPALQRGLCTDSTGSAQESQD